MFPLGKLFALHITMILLRVFILKNGISRLSPCGSRSSIFPNAKIHGLKIVMLHNDLRSGKKYCAVGCPGLVQARGRCGVHKWKGF
jgi:hypothetical protein